MFNIRLQLVCALPVLALASCATPGGETSTYLGADFVVVDDTEASVSGVGGGDVEADADYSMFRGTVGAIQMDGPAPVMRYGLTVGAGDYDDVDALELGLGGYWYVPMGESQFRPFFGAQALYTMYDDDPVDIGDEISAAPTAGVEFGINEQIAITAAAEYRIPISPADDADPAEFETEGLAIRLGIYFIF